jgi:hypothetical protein
MAIRPAVGASSSSPVILPDFAAAHREKCDGNEYGGLTRGTTVYRSAAQQFSPIGHNLDLDLDLDLDVVLRWQPTDSGMDVRRLDGCGRSRVEFRH